MKGLGVLSLGRSSSLAWLSTELCFTRFPLLFSPQGLLHHLPHDRHGQTLGKEGPGERLHVSRPRKLRPWQVRELCGHREQARERPGWGPCHCCEPGGFREKGGTEE